MKYWTIIDKVTGYPVDGSQACEGVSLIYASKDDALQAFADDFGNSDEEYEIVEVTIGHSKS